MAEFQSLDQQKIVQPGFFILKVVRKSQCEKGKIVGEVPTEIHPTTIFLEFDGEIRSPLFVKAKCQCSEDASAGKIINETEYIEHLYAQNTDLIWALSPLENKNIEMRETLAKDLYLFSKCDCTVDTERGKETSSKSVFGNPELREYKYIIKHGCSWDSKLQIDASNKIITVNAEKVAHSYLVANCMCSPENNVEGPRVLEGTSDIPDGLKTHYMQTILLVVKNFCKDLNRRTELGMETVPPETPLEWGIKFGNFLNAVFIKAYCTCKTVNPLKRHLETLSSEEYRELDNDFRSNVFTIAVGKMCHYNGGKLVTNAEKAKVSSVKEVSDAATQTD